MTYVPTRAADASALLTPAGHRPGLLRRLVAAIRRAAAIRRSRRQLQALPDDLLKDIGINRCDVHAVVEGLVDGRHDPTRRFRSRLGR